MKTKKHAFACLCLIVVGLAPLVTLGANSMEGAAPSSPSIAVVQSAYGKLPLSFEANQGQWEPSVQFVTRGRGHTLFLTPNHAVLSVRTSEVKDQGQADRITQHKSLTSPSATSQSVVRMSFTGADPQAEVMRLEQLPGIVNYFIGDDPTKWRTNIPTYQKVGYKDLYPGIDLVYYGNQGQLEYDLIVAPGADPTQITLAFDGAEQIAVDEQGDLALTLPQSSTETAEGTAPTLRLHKPVVYQRDEQGKKHPVDGTYTLLTHEQSSDRGPSVVQHPIETLHVAFQIAAYDASRSLIIDPVLSWATYLGGSGGDIGYGIAVDTGGNAYVTGQTSSSNFPGTAGSAIQSTLGAAGDAFVTKLDAAGTALVYSTYLGGSGGEEGRGIAVDAAGHAYVTGFTDSSNFPGTAGSAIQGTLGGSSDTFVVKLNEAGTALVYSTYLGGSDQDIGWGIVVDAVGNAYVTGQTSSSNFPITAGSAIQNTLDAFVTKLNEAGTALAYSTYLGGSDFDIGNGIAVDAAGNAYVTGYTSSTDFPGTTGSPVQPTPAGGFLDAFVTKLNEAGTALAYSTYLGGSNIDIGKGIAVDAAGNAYVTGVTSSTDFPGTASSPVQSTFGGNTDAFVTKLNEAGTALAYSTYLGGSNLDFANGIAVDAAGNTYVTGQTSSSNFPGTAGSAIQSTLGAAGDAFVTKLNAAGTALAYSTYLGGSSQDFGNGIAVDAAGNAYVTGQTSSSNFPGTASSPVQGTFGGNTDAFVAKITSSIPFAAFDVRANIDMDKRRHHDEFELRATFTLGPGSNGIAPRTEPMIVQVGTFSATIPAGSFKHYNGRFVFEGAINGVHLEAVLRSLIFGNDYELKVEGHGADLAGTANPVTVSLTIGDDSGSKAITAKIK